jgi:ParB family chromosome partitioning protein
MSKLTFASGIMLGVIEEIGISKIRPSSNLIRPTRDSVSSLANSIKQKGLLQPIVVRSVGEFFEIVAGNRRYHACKILGWRKIACHLVELTDKEAFEISIIENLQRKTLNPIDEARAFKAYVSDFGWGGVSELAETISRSASYVTKRIKLLDLPDDLFDSIVNSKMDTSKAEELCYLRDKSMQSELGRMIAERRLSLRNVRRLVKEMDEDSYLHKNIRRIDQIDNQTRRAFDKTIVALRIAMSTLGEIIVDIEENWIIHEILMQHKNMLHSQIDVLIKQKRKI